MIVVAIIAILAGILIPNFVNARAQAQTSACESNLRSIATALELLYADEQDYGAAGTRNVTPDNMKGASGVYYINNTPKDPAALDCEVRIRKFVMRVYSIPLAAVLEEALRAEANEK